MEREKPRKFQSRYLTSIPRIEKGTYRYRFIQRTMYMLPSSKPTFNIYIYIFHIVDTVHLRHIKLRYKPTDAH
jgi:hypothetical protein